MRLIASSVPVITLALAVGCGKVQPVPAIAATSSPAAAHSAVAADRTAQVRALLESIESGDPAPVGVIDPNRYTQHNLDVADGLSGFGAALAALPVGSARARVVRVYEDGDYVFAHTDYNFFGPKIGFDVFRFDGDQIVEHWDNLQETPSGTNPSGRSMTDGPTLATDLDLTGPNKDLVRSFITDILVNGEMDKLAGYFDGDSYIQHNPNIADGLSGLGAALGAMADQGIRMQYDHVHDVLGQGNMVLVMSEGQFAGQHTAFYDLFRVEDGKIAEHWDVLQVIPPESEWKNDNGKF